MLFVLFNYDHANADLQSIDAYVQTIGGNDKFTVCFMIAIDISKKVIGLSFVKERE